MSDTFGVLVNLSPFYGLEEGVAWIKALKERAEHEGLKFFLALPFDILNSVASAPAPSFLVMGAQGMNPVKAGSFNEAIAGRLLSSLGAKFVLLGTRRARKEGESNETIRDKLKKAKEGGLIPILCIGETAEERQQEQTAEVLTRQIGEATLGMDAAELAGLQVVYEAPWVQEAFSRPTDQEIDHAYQFCRDLVHSLFGEPLASSVKVYCPVPSDLKEADSFIHTLQADGFYFCDPHQLTAVDEASLRAKASTARKVREADERMIAAVGEPVQQAEASLKQLETLVEPEAMVETEEKPEESAAEVGEGEVRIEATEALEEKLQVEEVIAAEAQVEEEVAAEGEVPEVDADKESSVEEEVEEAAEEEVPEAVAAEEAPVEKPQVEEATEAEVPEAIAAPPEEEVIPEEKPEEKIRDVTVSHITPTVSEARKKRRKKAEE